MNTIEIDKHTYSIGNLDAMTQFHVSRRIAPMMSSVLLSLAMVRGSTAKEDILVAATPGINVLSAMDDVTCEYVLARCLDVVQRDIGGGKSWAQVNVKGTTNMMFEDMNMMTLLRLTAEVIRVNLWGFIQGLGEQGTSPSS